MPFRLPPSGGHTVALGCVPRRRTLTDISVTLLIGGMVHRILLVLVFVLLMLCCVAGSLPSSIAHNRQLDEYTEAFESIAHPDGTQSVRLWRTVGLLAGDGNHCDYFVGEVRTLAGEPWQVEAFYSQQRVDAYRLRVAFARDGVFVEDEFGPPRGFDEVGEWVQPSEYAGDLYLVYMLILGYPAEGDWRCH
jgi:hypothetical protein